MAKTLYELSSEFIGDGSSKYIDTGVPLLNSDNINKSWTLLLDIKIKTLKSTETSIVHSIHEEAPNYGFLIDFTNTTLRCVVPSYTFTLDKGVSENEEMQLVLIKDGNTYSFYKNQMEQLFSHTTQWINLTLMAILNVDGSYDRFNDGTLYRCKLIDRALSSNECLQWINGTYDDGNDNETTEDSTEFNGDEYQDSYSSPLPTGTGQSGIEGMSEDSWGNENYELPCALYFYYMGDDINGGNEYENWNTEYTNAVLGNCSAIQSVQYVPFLRKDDLMLNAVPYDIARFGQLQASHPKLDYAPYVYRVKALTTQVKSIGSFNCYSPSKSIGGTRNWRNESRLYNYPYQFAMITDHLNPPMEIKYHLVPSSQANVKVIQTISDRCSYGIYVEGYKGDNGQLEAMVSGEAHELPCSSSAYNQWFATNKNQVAQNVRNMSETAFLQNGNIIDNQKYNILNSTVGLIGSALSGNIGGMATSVIGGFQNNMNMNFQQRMNNVGVQQQVAMNLAQQQDLRNTPNTIISMGSDVYYGLAKGGFSLDVYKFGLTNEYNQKLGDHFAMYGYKQNKVMNINTQNRYYYNYIKTVGVNIQSSKIPRSHLEEIKSIFDNGVTIWHTFRDGVTVGDYSMDNKEV